MPQKDQPTVSVGSHISFAPDWKPHGEHAEWYQVFVQATRVKDVPSRARKRGAALALAKNK